MPEVDVLVTHAIWADNLFVIGSSKQMVAEMLAMAGMAMHPWGLVWKSSSLSCLANAPAEREDGRQSLIVPTVSPDQPSLTCPVVKEMIVLGVCLDREGSSQCSIRHRLGAASKHFHARRAQLCCKQAPFRGRVDRFYKTVVRTLLYGAGGWILYLQ